MPEISRFHGVVITMYRNEHGPPHFHARSGGEWVHVEILSGRIIGRSFPLPARRRVSKWLEIHRLELLEDWSLAERGQKPFPIDPLE